MEFGSGHEIELAGGWPYSAIGCHFKTHLTTSSSLKINKQINNPFTKAFGVCREARRVEASDLGHFSPASVVTGKDRRVSRKPPVQKDEPSGATAPPTPESQGTPWQSEWP